MKLKSFFYFSFLMAFLFVVGPATSSVFAMECSQDGRTSPHRTPPNSPSLGVLQTSPPRASSLQRYQSHMKTKRFVILYGASSSGKTSLVEAMKQANDSRKEAQQKKVRFFSRDDDLVDNLVSTLMANAFMIFGDTRVETSRCAANTDEAMSLDSLRKRLPSNIWQPLYEGLCALFMNGVKEALNGNDIVVVDWGSLRNKEEFFALTKFFSFFVDTIMIKVTCDKEIFLSREKSRGDRGRGTFSKDWPEAYCCFWNEIGRPWLAFSKETFHEYLRLFERHFDFEVDTTNNGISKCAENVWTFVERDWEKYSVGVGMFTAIKRNEQLVQWWTTQSTKSLRDQEVLWTGADPLIDPLSDFSQHLMKFSSNRPIDPRILNDFTNQQF